VRILLISFYFPPAGGGGVQRPLKLATHLPSLGVETHVLAPVDPRWLHRDETLALPPDAVVHRVRYWGPRGRMPAEELRGRRGLDRLATRARLTPRRLVLPDENATFALTAIPAALRLVRELRPDVVITTSPPSSIHLVGAAVQRLTGVRWVADVRDSIVANHDRDVDRLAVRLREASHRRVAHMVARRASGIVAVTPTIATQMRTLDPRGPVTVIPNGVDFADFASARYTPGPRFRITHTGSFFAGRSPRPFLEALARSGIDAVARFVGDFRGSDRSFARDLGLDGRVEVVPFRGHAETVALQRDSEALLLLLPDAGERGLDVPSGKLFEYLAAERPVLASVPVDGAAAALVREAHAGIVVAPDDVEAMAQALRDLHARWQADPDATLRLAGTVRARIDRRTQALVYAEFLSDLL
jgi:glycosyltransferase involved in cell wall biosynthesis